MSEKIRLEALERRVKVLEDFLLSNPIFPDFLQRTLFCVKMYGLVTAEDVANYTKRARACESSYLNQLVRQGHLVKFRKGRKAYFRCR